MKINLGPDRPLLEFRQNEDEYVLRVKLALWKDFASDHSEPGRQGEKASFVLQAVDDSLAPEANYAAAIRWFLTHQTEIQQQALGAIHTYILDVLIGEYELDDEELLSYRTSDQLSSMMDLSYVRFYPQSKDGLPYFGLELECNWDPEHGCGVMFHGAKVVDIGMAETVQGGFDIDEDGGEI